MVECLELHNGSRNTVSATRSNACFAGECVHESADEPCINMEHIKRGNRLQVAGVLRFDFCFTVL